MSNNDQIKQDEKKRDDKKNKSVRTSRINTIFSQIVEQSRVLEETKKDNPLQDCLFGSSVGMTRFELATPRPPDVCATGLRYIPKIKSVQI